MSEEVEIHISAGMLMQLLAAFDHCWEKVADKPGVSTKLAESRRIRDAFAMIRSTTEMTITNRREV